MRLILLLALAAPGAAQPRLDSLLKAVETRYNHAQTLKLNFTETLAAEHRPERSERGTLTLRKPGRMRWDYAQPAGKVFVSDGRRVTLFNPETNQVEVTALRETDDFRAPLAFLLGKLNFYKEFRAFALRPGPDGATWITAEANSADLPYSRVEFLATPDGRILALKVQGDDRSLLSFAFSSEELNVTVDPKLFQYRAPITAQILTEGER